MEKTRVLSCVNPPTPAAKLNGNRDPVAHRRSGGKVPGPTNCTAGELKESGFSAAELRDRGYKAGELKELGFSAEQLRDGGFTVEQLKIGGHTAGELKDGGFSAKQLIKAEYFEMQLQEAGFTNAELSQAQLKLLLEEGVKDARTLKEKGFNADQLKKENFDTRSLIDAGFSVVEQREAGCTLRELVVENVPPRILREAVSYLRTNWKVLIVMTVIIGIPIYTFVGSFSALGYGIPVYKYLNERSSQSSITFGIAVLIMFFLFIFDVEYWNVRKIL